MPRSVRKRREGESGKLWKITDGGKVVGQSDTREKAWSSAQHANEAK